MTIQKTTLSNGLTIATDNIPNFETVSIGMFVKVGAINENIQNNGVSHFVEHMAFKGTSKRSALQISEAIENVGGYINACTGKEITAFYAKVLKGDSKLAIDVITDIVQDSSFDRDEFEKERGVIIQEIKQYEDTPDDVVFDIFQRKCFEDQSLGRSILGPESNILSFENTVLKDYLKDNYSASKMILSASGNIEHERFVDLANEYIDKLQSFDTKNPDIQKYVGGSIHQYKDIEQSHIIVGFEGVSHYDENRYVASIMSTILGGGMSSRLFQEVREKRGLAYSIFSYMSHYADTGIFGIYAGSDTSKTMEVARIIKDVLENFSYTINESEIIRAKNQMKASLLMGLESSSTRMERMSHQYLIHDRFIDPKEISKKIDDVEIEDIVSFARSIIKSKPTVALVGREDNTEKIYEVFI